MISSGPNPNINISIVYHLLRPGAPHLDLGAHLRPLIRHHRPQERTPARTRNAFLGVQVLALQHDRLEHDDGRAQLQRPRERSVHAEQLCVGKVD